MHWLKLEKRLWKDIGTSRNIKLMKLWKPFRFFKFLGHMRRHEDCCCFFWDMGFLWSDQDLLVFTVFCDSMLIYFCFGASWLNDWLMWVQISVFFLDWWAIVRLFYLVWFFWDHYVISSWHKLGFYLCSIWSYFFESIYQL